MIFLVRKIFSILLPALIMLFCIPLNGNRSDLHVNRKKNNKKDGLWFFTHGYNVSSCFTLGSNLHQCLLPDGLVGSYFVWSKNWVLPGNYGTISFSAMATNDIHVGVSIINPWRVKSTGDFYAHLVSSSNLYEFVIGGWGNGQSVIRKGSQAEPVKAVSRGIPINQHTGQAVNSLVRYKIIFYQGKKHRKDTIAVYYRKLHGNRHNKKWTKLMSYKDPALIRVHTKRWFSLSSWDTSIFYTDIKASGLTRLPHTKR